MSGSRRHHPDPVGVGLVVDGHHQLVVGHRPADRAVDQLVHRGDHRHPDHGRCLFGHAHRHRLQGLSGSATFTWTITNTVTVTNPGTHSNVSGSRHHHPDPVGVGLVVHGHHQLVVGHRAARRPVDQHVHRRHHRHPDHGRCLFGDAHRHRQRRHVGLGHLHLDITNAVTVTNPGTQSNVSGAAIAHVDPVGLDSSSTGHHQLVVGHRAAGRALDRTRPPGRSPAPRPRRVRTR